MEYTCGQCHKIFEIQNVQGSYIRKFCSKKCRDENVKTYFKRNFIWDEATEEERTLHIRDYYEKNVIRNETGCWDWKKKCKTDKYVRMNYCRNQPKLSAHIYSWIIHNGQIPPGMLVCHKCDNGRCTNPEHLFLGSHRENVNDMIAKYRHCHGESHGCSKLTSEQVKQIKELCKSNVSSVKIAKEFNVSKTSVLRIKNSVTWKHVS